jgi:hypothetical protein
MTASPWSIGESMMEGLMAAKEKQAPKPDGRAVK